MRPRNSVIVALAVLIAAVPTSAAAAPARTLPVRKAKPLAKQALRTEYTVKRYVTKSCKRLGRLRVRCRSVFRDGLGDHQRATVIVARTGTRTDDRERYGAIVRRRGTPTRRFSGLIVEPTRRSVLGLPLTLLAQNDGRVRVTPGALIDPVPVGEFDTPPAGTRYVGVPIAVENVGAGQYDDSLHNGSRLITAADMTINTSIIVSPPCDQGSVDVPARERRIGCVAFAVPFGTVLRAFEYRPNSGFGPEAGQWVIRP